MRCSLLQLKCMIVSEDTEYAIISSTMQSMSLITTKDNLLTKRICKTSLDSRPIKIRPGTYCRGDSAHALQITQNMGNRTTNIKP